MMVDVMNMEESLFLEQEGSKNLLITFGGIRQGVGMPPFEFKRTIQGIPCDKLFIRDLNQMWYQKGINTEIDTISKLSDHISRLIKSEGYDRIVCLGNSMGGYAAITIGSELGVHKILAFSPQTFIGRWKRLRYNDSRWSKQMKRIHRQVSSSKYFDLLKLLKQQHKKVVPIKIYYGLDDPLDVIHAERLAKIPGLSLNGMNGDHNVVKTLRDRGNLVEIITNCFK